jgi:hypothetical protein
MMLNGTMKMEKTSNRSLFLIRRSVYTYPLINLVIYFLLFIKCVYYTYTYIIYLNNK